MADRFVDRTRGSQWQSALPTGSKWLSALPTGSNRLSARPTGCGRQRDQGSLRLLP